MASNPAFTERNIQKANVYLLDSRPEQKSLVTYHTLPRLYVCVCQHFYFNSTDWISDNLNVISIWYLRTKGKEFIFRFSRRFWGRNAWRTPQNVCVGGKGEGGADKQWKLVCDCSGILGEAKWRIQMRSCCCQLYVAFSFKEPLLNGNFWDTCYCHRFKHDA